VLTALAAAAIVATTQAPAAPSAKIQICGQKKGPSTAWSDTIPGHGTFKFKGNTWTVFATEVSCKFALSVTPGHLKQWAKQKVGGHWRSQGWLCSKEKAKGYSGKGVASGSIGCVGPTANFISIAMYAPYTLAQIKQVAATGKLPGG
jgi:hypothetical protein